MQPDRPVDANPPDQPLERLLADRRFVRFATAKFLQLVAQNALIYGLFITVIADQKSYLATSAFVLASVLPSVLLSLPGGLVADALPKKTVLLATMVWRIAIVWLFIDFSLGVGAVLILTFVAWTAYQFFTPAENAALPAVAPPHQIASATSMLQALSLAAQLLGAGAVAPIAVKFLGRDGLFYLVGGLLVTSTVFYAIIPRLSPAGRPQRRQTGWWSSLPQGYRAIRGDDDLVRITILRILLDTGTMMVVVAAPKFIEDSLNAGSEYAVYIASPAALGIGIGLLLAPPLLAFISGRTLAVVGYCMFTLVLIALPFIDPISLFVTNHVGFLDSLRSFTGLSRQVIMTVVILPWAGLGISLVQVSARAEVYKRVRPALIAQVFATQSALGSIAALLPTFLAGAILDVLPVEAFLGAVAAALVALAIAGSISAPELAVHSDTAPLP